MQNFKKVLIVTYYWPPAGGPGVQRWLKFVKYLRHFNIEPLVYVPENPEYPLLDADLEKEIPENIRIFRQPILEPYKLASFFSKKGTKSMSRGLIKEKEQGVVEKALLWIRGNLFIPDARKFWVTPSVNYLKTLIETEQVDAIITTGPPHSLHLIGMKLKTLTGVKWVADFRDPWTTIGYHNKLKLGSWAQKKHRQLEKKVLQQADRVLATSKTTARELERISERPVMTITNGYDEPDRVDYEPAKAFCLSHIGSLLSGRDPKILWEALCELTHEIKGFKDDLKIKLVGAVSEDVLASIRHAGLSPYLITVDYVPHSEALKLQREARVLLLLEIDAEITRGIIPGKLFEYMAARRPVLAIGPEQWEVGTILQETRVGKAYTYSEKLEVKEAIKSLYDDYLNNTDSSEGASIETYTRKALTGRLAQLLHDF